MNHNISEKRTEYMSKALIHLSEFNIKDFLKEIFNLYKWYLQNYPMYTKGLTSCIIAMLGEIVASNVKARVRKEPVTIDLKRVGIFGLYGLCCTGPMLHQWYTFLEYLLTVRMNLSGKAKILAKLFIDRVIWGPPFVLFTISFLQLLQTLSPKETFDAVKRSYAAVLFMNQSVWVPGQLCNFAVIPVEYQVLFVNAVNVGWNTYLSMSQ